MNTYNLISIWEMALIVLVSPRFHIPVELSPLLSLSKETGRFSSSLIVHKLPTNLRSSSCISLNLTKNFIPLKLCENFVFLFTNNFLKENL